MEPLTRFLGLAYHLQPQRPRHTAPPEPLSRALIQLSDFYVPRIPGENIYSTSFRYTYLSDADHVVIGEHEGLTLLPYTLVRPHLQFGHELTTYDLEPGAR